MTRFTLHDPAFADPGIEQPGEILTLGWPHDGEPLVLPQLGWRFPDGKPEQHWRNFTVRSFDPGARDDRRRRLPPRRHRARVGVGAARVGRRPGRLRRPAHALGARPAGALDAARRRRDRPARAAGDPRDAAGRPPRARARRGRGRRRAPAGRLSPPTSTCAGSRATAARPARRPCSPTRCGACGSRPSAARRGAAARRWRCATCAATSSPTTRRSRRGTSWATGNTGRTPEDVDY